MILAIRHIGLVVSDIDKAVEFWCGPMNFIISRHMEEEGPHIDAMMGLKDVQVTTIKLEAPDGNILELLHFKSHPGKKSWSGNPYSTGLTHIALSVNDLDKTYKDLNEYGVEFPALPQYSPDGNVKVIYARGPEGILLELVEILK